MRCIDQVSNNVSYMLFNKLHSPIFTNFMHLWLIVDDDISALFVLNVSIDCNHARLFMLHIVLYYLFVYVVLT